MDLTKLQEMKNEYLKTLEGNEQFNAERNLNKLLFDIESKDSSYLTLFSKAQERNNQCHPNNVVPSLDDFIVELENEFLNILEEENESGTIEGLHAKIDSQDYELTKLKNEIIGLRNDANYWKHNYERLEKQYDKAVDNVKLLIEVIQGNDYHIIRITNDMSAVASMCERTLEKGFTD